VLTVITGPPCAGKSTYLRQHAVPGSVVIDFDDLAQALGSPVTHGHDSSHHWVTVAARGAAITAAIAAHRRGTPVWITDTSPPPARLRQYQAAGAELVRLTAPAAELHARAAAGRPPEWHERIDRWLAEHGHDA